MQQSYDYYHSVFSKSTTDLSVEKSNGKKTLLFLKADTHQ